MTRAIFLRYAKKLRPVWTLTYLELTQPSLKTAPKTPDEHDVYFNADIATQVVLEIGESNIWNAIHDTQQYLDTPEAEYAQITHTTAGHKYYSSEKQAIGYLLTNIKLAIRHKHGLKY
jgi:hypothetical protein